jgi:predicted kinase
MVGISGSGKSTTAQILQKNEDNCIILNRDKFREQLFGFGPTGHKAYYSRPDYSRHDLKEREKTVSRFFDNAVKTAIRNGYSVVADNTHLNMRYINHYKKFATPFELVVCDVDLETCLQRDRERERQVGEEVIRKQYDQFKSLIKRKDFNATQVFAPEPFKAVNDPKKPWAYVFDLDGTLAIHDNRSPYDWKKLSTDIPNRSLVRVLSLLEYSKDHVIFCTGRDGESLNLTASWLHAHLPPIQGMRNIMIREPGNSEPDWMIKQRMWAKICEDYYIAAMFDDRDQVVDHARRLGFQSYQVNYGDF